MVILDFTVDGSIDIGQEIISHQHSFTSVERFYGQQFTGTLRINNGSMIVLEVHCMEEQTKIKDLGRFTQV